MGSSAFERYGQSEKGLSQEAFVNTYGSDVFEMTDSSIKCTIPFDEYVLLQTDIFAVGLNVGLSNSEKKVIELLLLNPNENVLTLNNHNDICT